MSYDNYHLQPAAVRNGSPPRVVVRAADDAAYVIGTYRPSSSKTRVLNWKDPILQACAAGDSRSLIIMYAEAKACVDERTQLPTPDEMFLAAIADGRIPILRDIHDLFPKYEWSSEVFAAAMKSDLDSGGNHYLLSVTRWSRNPMRVYGAEGDTLMWAVRLGDIESAVVLLSWGASPNGCKYQDRFSHLQVAASMYSTAKARYPPMVQLLMQYGANIVGTGILSWTAGTLGRAPPMQTVVNARDIAGHLLHAGVDVNETPPIFEDEPLEHVREVPLIAAACTGNAFMIDFLLYHGADAVLKDTKLGATAYEIAYLEDDPVAHADLMDAFAKRGISPATLWGIIDSDLKDSTPSPCKCGNINTDHDARWVPVQRSDF